MEEEVKELATTQPPEFLTSVQNSEIDMQIATAKKFPRSIKHFLDEAKEMVSLNERIASECIYALPRDGKTIEGPSARFAEVIASAWGNCRAGARIVGEDAAFVTAQGAFYDLQRNVAYTYEVRRRITTSKGYRYSADMIGVTANAAASIALRNAVLKGVPKAFWGEIYDLARQTIMGDAQTLTNRRADALAYLQKFGATEQMVCQTLGVAGIEDIGLDELVTLRGLATAIRDGDLTPEQAFAPKESEPTLEKKTESRSQTVKNKLAEKTKPKEKTEQAVEEKSAAESFLPKGYGE